MLQCLYRLENSGWLVSRWEDKDAATRDGRPPRRFYRLTAIGQREARQLLAERFKGHPETMRAAEATKRWQAERKP